ncbi:hypothetical protein N9N28_16960, partial [Rubripirellula amarantea]|nr:hypothetical protein [Rubripirellula amarantea]
MQEYPAADAREGDSLVCSVSLRPLLDRVTCSIASLIAPQQMPRRIAMGHSLIGSTDQFHFLNFTKWRSQT